MLFDTGLLPSLTFVRYESAVVQISPVLDTTIENAAVFEMKMRKRVPYLIEQNENRLTIHYNRACDTLDEDSRLKEDSPFSISNIN